MATLTNYITPASNFHGLRPFDIRRDLRQVADLVEQCFSDTLDPDGERYLQQMRSAASNPGFLRWAAAAAEWANLPLTGYVWEEDQHLVGNVSLIPYKVQGRRCYLIANVAVHPDHRRRGIARALTARALEHAQKHNTTTTWLHVRESNEPAVTLYRSMGFIERARRTTWYNHGNLPIQPLIPGVQVTLRRPHHWPVQRAWLQSLYPPELTWHLSLSLNALQPGLLGTLHRMMSTGRYWQWSAVRGRRLLGVLSWQSTPNYADSLWLASNPQDEEEAAFSLLMNARRRLTLRRPLSLDYPAHRAVQAISAAGFQEHQTLIWMEKIFPPAI